MQRTVQSNSKIKLFNTINRKCIVTDCQPPGLTKYSNADTNYNAVELCYNDVLLRYAFGISHNNGVEPRYNDVRSHYNVGKGRYAIGKSYSNAVEQLYNDVLSRYTVGNQIGNDVKYLISEI